MNEKYSLAAVLSAIWPGLGQLYQKKTWAPLVMLGYGALGFWLVSSFAAYKIEKLERSYLEPDATFVIPLIIMIIIWLSCVYGPIASQREPGTNDYHQVEAPSKWKA